MKFKDELIAALAAAATVRLLTADEASAEEQRTDGVWTPSAAFVSQHGTIVVEMFDPMEVNWPCACR